MTADVSITMNRDFQKYLNTAFGLFRNRRTQELLVRSLARARRDLERAYVRALKKSIRKSRIKNRSGRLARRKGAIVISSRQRQGKSIIGMNPTFPLTAYRTPRGRGRPRASKQGQYAFVLDSSRGFIDAAFEEFQSDIRVRKAIGKHVVFIAHRLLQEQRRR